MMRIANGRGSQQEGRIGDDQRVGGDKQRRNDGEGIEAAGFR